MPPDRDRSEKQAGHPPFRAFDQRRDARVVQFETRDPPEQLGGLLQVERQLSLTDLVDIIAQRRRFPTTRRSTRLDMITWAFGGRASTRRPTSATIALLR